MKIEIKNKYNDDVIFEYDCKDNNIKKTVTAAVSSGILLDNADLENADLRDANLKGANLSMAFLVGADLENTNLCGANLKGANLAHATLTDANFRGASLREACLVGTNLKGTIFSGASLRDASFLGAVLKNTVFIGADLRGTRELPFIPLDLPVGEFIAWKKCKNIIIKLKILEDSKRSRATTYKCRCDKALVLGFEELDGTPITNITEIVNTSFTRCHYKVGEVVYADEWDEDRWSEYTHGIYFFLDRQSAVKY